MSLKAQKIKLKKDEERRVLAGHPWIYSNEIEGKLKGFDAGRLVDVHSSAGRFLGRGYINPGSLISVRLLTREREETGRAFFTRRFRQARAIRDRYVPGRLMRREVYGEADGLPGLVVDRYGTTLAVQVSTAGIEAAEKYWRPALEEVYAPEILVYVGRGSGRETEGLAERVEVIRGELSGLLWVKQDGIDFPVDILEGQKTGFFLDHEDNRRRVCDFVAGRTFLDAFCYTGAFALRALAAGASHATLIDSSARALGIAAEAMARNGFGGRCELVEADAFAHLRVLAKEERAFGVVGTDPPALAKSRKDVRAAEQAYADLATNALALTEAGGLCVASSCTFHVPRERFRLCLARGASKALADARILEFRGAAADHPLHPAVAESEYLKCALLARG